MTEAEAIAELQARVAADVYPTLSEAEILAILNMCRIVDSDGYAPVDEDYTPTWDLARAEVWAWRRKAAKATADTDFQQPQGGISQSQIIRNCLAMAKEASRSVFGTVSPRAHPESIDGVIL